VNTHATTASAPRLQPALCFDLGVERYAISLDRVCGVGALERVERVPGTPPGVFGLWNRGGRIYTVIDLPGLLLRDSWSGESWAVRLVRPFPYLALRVPASLRSQNMPLVAPGETWLTTFRYGGRRTHRIEIQPLVELLEPQARSY